MGGSPRGPTLHVAVMRTGSSAVVRVQGELDVATAQQLDDALNALTADQKVRRIVVDADGLSFVDASGLAPLLAARRRLGDGSLRLRHVKPPVLRVLRLLDLAALFGVET